MEKSGAMFPRSNSCPLGAPGNHEKNSTLREVGLARDEELFVTAPAISATRASA